jgi:hypothetical protein
VSDRRAQAAATLARLGLDADALAAGTAAAPDVAARLAGTDGRTIAAALADLVTPAVARLLVELEPAVTDRAVRKEIRRTLYRLRQRGVAVPEPTPPPVAPSSAPAGDVEGFVSAFDARGDRVVWIVRAQPTGGALLVAATMNEPAGLRDVHAGEASRKQIRAVRQRMEAEAKIRMVAADWRVLDALLVEAHERAGDGGAERDWLRLRPRLTTDPPRPPAEPVSRRAVAPTPEEAPALVAGSAALVAEPELRGWYPTPEASSPFVDEIRTVRESPIVLSRMAQEERVREVLRRAAATLFPPVVLARRLDGTAYVFAETGRTAAARQALAVASAIRARPAEALEVPLVATLVERAVGTLLAETTAREEEARRGSLVVTPGEALRDRASSRPGRTRG